MPPARPRRALVRVARAVVLAAGWATFAVGGLALAVEESGLLERWIERELAARLGPAAGHPSIRDAHVSWSGRTVRLEGLAFGDIERELAVERLELLVGWSPARGLFLERAVADGGRLRLSRALITGWKGLVDGAGERGLRPGGPFPTIAVLDLAIAIETPDWGNLPLGRLDACFQPGDDGRPHLTGRLVPALEGDGGPGAIYLSGSLGDEGMLEVRGAARDLPLSTSFLPDEAPLDALRALEPRARCDLEARGRFVLGEDVLPRMHATLALSDGRAHLPWVEDPGARSLDDVRVRIAASFDAGEVPSLWQRDAWSIEADARAVWSGAEGTAVPIELRARVGRAAGGDDTADVWARVPRLALDESVLDVAGRPGWLVELWESLSPGGSAEVLAAARLPRDWTPGERALDRTPRAIVVRPGGLASAAYVGGANENAGGARNLGFPLPLSGVRGTIGYTYRPERAAPEELGLYELTAEHGGGQVLVRGAGFFVPGHLRPADWTRDRSPNRFHLLVESANVPVDAELERAFDGLRGIPGCERIWSDYGPSGGHLDVRLELWKVPERPLLASDVTVDVHGVDFEWDGFPLPVESVRGRLRVIGEGRREVGRTVITLDASGTAEAARGPVRVAGRAELGPGPARAAYWDVDVEEANLRSFHLRDVLARRQPAALAALDRADAAGWVDAHVTFAQVDREATSWLEVHTAGQGVRAQPRIFPMDTRDVLGRLIAVTEHDPERGDGPARPPRSEVRFGFSGRWGGSSAVPVWAGASYPADRPGTITALGAGLDVDNPAVLGALETALSAARDEPVQIDVEKIDVAGHLDFAAEFTLPEEEGGELVDSRIVLQARLEHLGIGGVSLLKTLRGRLAYSKHEEEWVGERLSGVLGRTPVVLTDVRFRQDDVSSRLDARLTAEGLPADREHLRYFLDDRTLRTLLEDFEYRGWFDVDGAALSLEATPAGETSLRFRGDVSVRDMFVRLGVPVSIRSAEDVDLELYYEGNRVRSRAQVRELYGQVAGRRLDAASMQLTYIEPRLSIEKLRGSFEGGVLRSTGHRASRTASFFSIDFEEPFPFALSAEMDDVDVGQLLRGVFNSDFANTGRLAASMRMSGDFGHLTGIRGGGSFRLTDSALWAIPAFQALFARLGLDTTAIFSSVESRYRIADGVVEMTNLRVDSDLLSLVGEGSIDFDGSLAHDLEVRYSLVDRLGPLTRLVYHIQNSLLRISIRGDMSRPDVFVKGLFSGFFGPSEEVQRLPLPPFAELPGRF